MFLPISGPCVREYFFSSCFCSLLPHETGNELEDPIDASMSTRIPTGLAKFLSFLSRFLFRPWFRWELERHFADTRCRDMCWESIVRHKVLVFVFPAFLFFSRLGDLLLNYRNTYVHVYDYYYCFFLFLVPIDCDSLHWLLSLCWAYRASVTQWCRLSYSFGISSHWIVSKPVFRYMVMS